MLAVGIATNEATIEGNEGGTKTSNPVVVKVPANPAYTIEKQQRLAGEPFFTVSELTGELGETVEYQIIVNNTGNVPLKFAPLKDAGCEGITPSGATELAVGTGETFLCSTRPRARSAPTPTKPRSNPTKAGPRPPTKWSSKSRQSRPSRSKSSSDSKAKRTTAAVNSRGKLGQTDEYRITVKNTGNIALKFGALKDAGCEGIAPSGATERRRRCRRVLHLQPRARCRHLPPTKPRSKATKARAPRPPTKSPPKCPPNRSFSIEKQQRIAGEGTYGGGELNGKLGQTVEYKIIVKNTGNVTLKFSALKDTGCEGLTPTGTTELNVGEEESFTCTHVLTVGTTTNEASIEGNEGTGTKTSNK